ncbi:hypothetical protein D3C81_700840 [compost metagenome]
MSNPESMNEMLTQRGSRYGTLMASGQIAQDLEDYLRKLPNWELLAADQKESLSMIMHKVSRIMAGDPNWIDSWLDVAGYSTRVVERLQGEESRPDPRPVGDMPQKG